MIVSSHVPKESSTIMSQEPDDVRTLATYEPPVKMSLDQTIGTWIIAKKGRSKSVKTERAYIDTLTDFRATLQHAGLDLDAPASQIAPLLQLWAAFSKKPGGGTVQPSTFNQRLAILSSFYQYAVRHEVLETNPAARIDQQKLVRKNAAHHLSSEEVKIGLARIDRKTLEGKRDYALLSLALATGKRVSELANLRYEDLQKEGKRLRVAWDHLKGNEQRTDLLQMNTSTALSTYLDALPAQNSDAPLWISLSRRNQGQALSTRSLERICERWFGTSRFHTTRHTHAVQMDKRKATLAEIGRSLGHKNLKTTSDYLDLHRDYENPYASGLEEDFGI